MKRPLRVVYFLGTGRCGSTLLDLMLGLAPDVQSTGELWTLARPIAREEAPCSCGAPASSCPFWSGVLERLPSGAGLPELARASRSFDRLRALPLTFVARSLGTPAYRAHAERIRALYEAIAARGGRPILVDSSKDPVRALSVGSAGGSGLEVLYIHLVRDGRAYLWSKISRPDGSGLRPDRAARPVPELIGLWTLTNLVASAFSLLGPTRYLRVRYEDLVTAPEASLSAIGAFVGLDVGPILRHLGEGRAPLASHLVSGNRLTRGRVLQLTPDLEWKRRLPTASARRFWWWAGWLSRLYGYSRGDARP